MNTAPPRLPGIPWANSSPVRLSPCANKARRARDMPASASIVVSSTAFTAHISPAVRMTNLSSPLSDTRRFVPLPITKGFAPHSRARPIRITSCSRFFGQANRRAGPPIRNDVYRLMGTSRSKGRSGRYTSMALSSFSYQVISCSFKFVSSSPARQRR